MQADFSSILSRSSLPLLPAYAQGGPHLLPGPHRLLAIKVIRYCVPRKPARMPSTGYNNWHNKFIYWKGGVTEWRKWRQPVGHAEVGNHEPWPGFPHWSQDPKSPGASAGGWAGSMTQPGLELGILRCKIPGQLHLLNHKCPS